MSVTVLSALEVILQTRASNLPVVVDHVNLNRVNSSGDLLEYYVKDAFCGISSSFDTSDRKLECYSNVFSYLGNSNNPPDFIVRNSVAVEVKKIEGANTNVVALNSSQPKDYLYSTDPRINVGCLNCESDSGGWTKKDMIYAVGNVVGTRIHSLWFVYGDCYAADKSVYDRVSNILKDGVAEIPGVEFGVTKELGRVNRIDPLGVTNLRIRGMWTIAHPGAVHRNLVTLDNDKTNIFVLLKQDTYNTMPNKPNLDRFVEQGILTIEKVDIVDPNNPAGKLKAILFSAKF